MRRIDQMLHLDSGEDFSAGDHQEYVRGGMREILLIGGAALLLVGGFVVSLF